MSDQFGFFCSGILYICKKTENILIGMKLNRLEIAYIKEINIDFLAISQNKAQLLQVSSKRLE